MQRFLAKYGAAYPSLIDDGGKTAIAYGVYGVPETYFIAPDGTIVEQVRGGAATELLEEVRAGRAGARGDAAERRALKRIVLLLAVLPRPWAASAQARRPRPPPVRPPRLPTTRRWTWPTWPPSPDLRAPAAGRRGHGSGGQAHRRRSCAARSARASPSATRRRHGDEHAPADPRAGGRRVRRGSDPLLLRASYGEFVRLQPPLRGVNWLVWLAPVLGLLLGWPWCRGSCATSAPRRRRRPPVEAAGALVRRPPPPSSIRCPTIPRWRRPSAACGRWPTAGRAATRPEGKA